MKYTSAVLVAVLFGSAASAQKATVTAIPVRSMPAKVDSNSPGFWLGEVFHLFNSTAAGPMLSTGADQTSLTDPVPSQMAALQKWAYWIESVWSDPKDHVVFGWYHQEVGPCGGTNYLAVPHIGAALSYDGGKTFLDLGTVISSGEPPDCKSKNGFVAGGNGDFTVILDRTSNYFYFFYSNYGGDLENQGVAVARMPFSSRYTPGGAVEKYYKGDWTQPGIQGLETPVFPAKVAWQKANTDSFWGPSIHWNTYLNSFAILMNRSCCTTRYPQAGIYVTFNPDLSKPAEWTVPKKIVEDTHWYPQVIGNGAVGTDHEAGKTAPLYIGGQARYQIDFVK